MTDEVHLEGGSMTHVVRVGDTIQRTPGRQSAGVQALLRHLESEGVDGAPRALGFDGQGRETVTFIDGELGFVWDDDVLPLLGSLIRRLHDAAASFDELPPLTRGERLSLFGRDEIHCRHLSHISAIIATPLSQQGDTSSKENHT